jgi:hypothetical protein
MPLSSLPLVEMTTAAGCNDKIIGLNQKNNNDD